MDWADLATRVVLEARCFTSDDIPDRIAQALREAARAATALERERCAKVAEHGGCTSARCDHQMPDGHTDLCPMGIAAAIREQDDE
jgi:hypothetical protein|tara:strand:- start:710 stop:967 length:258 start_codon:yes stop_codon:yes gene_type:complete